MKNPIKLKEKEMNKERYLEHEINKDLKIAILESQLAEAREFIEIVGKYGDCSNPLMAISRIMKHYDKLKEQG